MTVVVPERSQGRDIGVVEAVVNLGFRPSEDSVGILIGHLHLDQHSDIVIDMTPLNSVGRQTSLSHSRVEN